jgi:putative phosphoribosyl transferase
VAFIKKQGADRIIVAAPIVALDAIAEIAPTVDDVIALIKPHHFGGISAFYQTFDQTTDKEVIDLLAHCA